MSTRAFRAKPELLWPQAILLALTTIVWHSRPRLWLAPLAQNSPSTLATKSTPSTN